MNVILTSKQAKSVVFLLLLGAILSLPLWFGFFESKKTVNLPQEWIEKIASESEKNEDDYLFVYVGYAGCSLECPVTLSVVADVLTQRKQRLPLIFIDLLADSESTSTYAKQFHPNFITVPHSPAAVSVMNQLAVWFRIDNHVSASEPVVHSDRLYMLQKQSTTTFALITSFTGSSPNTKRHLTDWLTKRSR